MVNTGDSPNQEAELRMWGQLVIDSLLRPRLAARRVLALGLGPVVLLQAAVLTACLSTLLGYIALVLNPGAIDGISQALLAQPLRGAALQLAVMMLGAGLMARIGMLFGGTGSIGGALALLVWLNTVMVLLQAVQLVALIVLPPLAVLIALATLLWAVWTFAGFVAELHGFGNTLLVLAGTVLALMVLFFSLAMLMAILGFSPRGAG
jgi:hypothetical protein